jgi:hypothetical protein
MPLRLVRASPLPGASAPSNLPAVVRPRAPMSQPLPPPDLSRAEHRSGHLDPLILSAFENAQRRTIRACARAVSQLQAGASPAHFAELILSETRAEGFTQFLRSPSVRLGGLPSGHARTPAYIEPGCTLEFDLAPLDQEVFADFGAAFAFQTDREPILITEARNLCRSTCGFASRWKCTGELFVYAQAWATNHRRSLGDSAHVGFRCFPKRDRAAFLWPHSIRLAQQLRRNQIQWYNPRRMEGHYLVAPRLFGDDRSYCFREMVLVDGDTRRILGRDNLSEVGSLPSL